MKHSLAPSRQLSRTSTLLSIALTFSLPASGQANGQDPTRAYWRDAWRGWHFYEEPEPESAVPAPTLRHPKQASPAPTKPNKPPEVLELERLQRELEEARSIAIMRPTEANVRRYMAVEARAVAQASAFADVAQRLAWASPELDPSLQGRPVNAKALEVFEKVQASERAQSVAALSRDHALLFFFRSDCPYCQAFAPTLEAFRTRHGLQVVAVSLDGGTLPGFADARRDNGIATTLRVTQVPAVYLAQPYSGVITPIGFGVLSESQLIERIATAASTPPEASPAGSTLAQASGQLR